MREPYTPESPFKIENGSDEVDKRWLEMSEINSVGFFSVVAAADESVDAALAATIDADESDSVRLVELVVLTNELSDFIVGE